MVITWYGENCFKIQSGPTTLITDPPAENSGLKQPRFKYDIIIRSLVPSPVPSIDDSDEEAFSVMGPGEYQVKQFSIRGVPLTSESTGSYLKSAYLINDGELSLCFLGHISSPDLDASVVETLSEVDILILPGGGKPYLAQEDAAKLANQIEPSLVIPSCFKVPGLKRQANDVKTFLKEFGATAVRPEEKVTIKKRELNPEETKVAVLLPS